MQQFSLVYNNLFVFLEPVDEPRPTYDCGQLVQSTPVVIKINGHEDKRPSNLSNLNSVKYKIAQIK